MGHDWELDRIKDLEEKIENQADIITKLERSRKDLSEANKALRRAFKELMEHRVDKECVECNRILRKVFMYL